VRSTHPPPRDTAPDEVWASPGTLPTPGLLCIAAPGTGTNGKEEDILSGMQALKAHVRSGRIVIDEPIDLPEGAELKVDSLQLADAGDELDSEERERLHRGLDEAIASVRAGRIVDGDEVIRRLLSRS
jgi:hypothetical protein